MPGFLYAEDSSADGNCNKCEDFSDVAIHKFIRFLISKGEFYRAYVELLRLKSFYPDYLTRLNFHVTENYLLFNGKQYIDILKKKSGDDNYLLRSVNLLYRFDIYLNQTDYNRSETIISSWKYGSDPFFDNLFKKRGIFIYLMMRKYSEAESICREYSGEDFSKYNELIKYSKRGFGKQRRPIMGAILGIIPGMGYVYSGDVGTGIVALLAISINVLVTYFAFQTGNDAIGFFTGIIGTFFYTGSIVGGYLSTKRNNLRVMNNMHKFLINEIGLEEDREIIYKNYGIGKDE